MEKDKIESPIPPSPPSSSTSFRNTLKLSDNNFQYKPLSTSKSSVSSVCKCSLIFQRRYFAKLNKLNLTQFSMKMSPQFSMTFVTLFFIIFAVTFSRCTVDAASIILRRPAEIISAANEEKTVSLLRHLMDDYKIISIRPIHRDHYVFKLEPLVRPTIDDNNNDNYNNVVNNNINGGEVENTEVAIDDGSTTIFVDHAQKLQRQETEQQQQENDVPPNRQQQNMKKRNNAEVVNHILKNFSNLGRLGDVGR